MQNAFPNPNPLFPRFPLLACNPNDTLIITKLLTLATEFLNHFENLIIGSCGDKCVHLPLHMVDPIVLTEVKQIVLRHIKEMLTLNYYFIILPIKNLKKFAVPSSVTSCSLLTAIANWKHYKTKDISVLDFQPPNVLRSKTASFIFWVQYSTHQCVHSKYEMIIILIHICLIRHTWYMTQGI